MCHILGNSLLKPEENLVVVIPEEEFKETIEEAQIGVKYFKDRKKIAREYKRRLEKLTAIKEPKIFREPKKKR